MPGSCGSARAPSPDRKRDAVAQVRKNDELMGEQDVDMPCRRDGIAQHRLELRLDEWMPVGQPRG